MHFSYDYIIAGLSDTVLTHTHRTRKRTYTPSVCPSPPCQSSDGQSVGYGCTNGELFMMTVEPNFWNL